ncbi:hypothetical protein HS961_20555 [Comamonas piscis]|uniref:Uncharacterized protein n=1 Tax=Comamonas piscis TaxID=1562974 RepID=A0A7G5EM15_9BURK|nr:hypothetical protein [Comamonas piscis]QMV75040.1 hypothetical protein HS961_20555 [Comamonas piscis]WSO33521.1 hypothetical protein VUJ63_20620 [Comamonas piscis]
MNNLDGIKAVLLIHWLMQEPLKDLVTNRNFRSCFRLLEGLLEYWLWAEPGKQHCYGNRALNSPGDFQVGSGDTGTAVNGLYQYYRGSCSRAGLLDAQWTLEPQVASAMTRAWSYDATHVLLPELKRVLEGKSRPYQPKQLLNGAVPLDAVLRKVFSSTALTSLLQAQLLGSSAQVALAKHCAEIARQKVNGTAHTVAELLRRLRSSSNAASVLLPSLIRIEHCEQFLVVLQNSFDLLRALDRHTVVDAANRLEPHRTAHKAKAERFIALFSAHCNERDGQLAKLAEHLSQGKPQAFLEEMVRHHQRLVKERGAEPLLTIDEGKTVSPLGEDRPLSEVQLRLESNTHWNNGYYLSAVAAIHHQLFGEAA